VIPPIIHQTWRDADLPETMRASADSWRLHHPAWEHRLWTDADLAALVERRFPDFADIFRRYPKPIMRADLGRYLVLKAHGGLYADLDADALAPCDSLRASARPICFKEPDSHAALEFVRARGFTRLVSNAVIASPAGHPFWDHLLALLRRCRHAPNPLDATGPFVLTAAVESAPAHAVPDIRAAYLTSPLDKDGVTVPPPAGARDEAPLVRHRWQGTWWRVPAGNPPAPAAGAPPAMPSSTTPSPTTWRQRLAERRRAARLRRIVGAARALGPADPPQGSRVLVAVPVRDAAATLDALFASLRALDHPRRDLSLFFFESDSADDSLARLRRFVSLERGSFARVALASRRVGAPRYEPRWRPELQRPRRAGIARVRNQLLRRGLGGEDWVLWLDADVIAFPPNLVGALLAARAHVVQPNAVRVPGGPTFDMNGWKIERAQSEEAMRPYILDGLYQPPIGHQRLYLSDMRYRERVGLDSVGGTALLVDARLHRAGLVFPEAPYRNLIETEGFGALLRDRGIEIVGLPNLEVLHADR
jgi:hypothetical protein